MTRREYRQAARRAYLAFQAAAGATQGNGAAIRTLPNDVHLGMTLARGAAIRRAIAELVAKSPGEDWIPRFLDLDAHTSVDIGAIRVQAQENRDEFQSALRRKQETARWDWDWDYDLRLVPRPRPSPARLP